jgi:hypothetical protein
MTVFYDRALKTVIPPKGSKNRERLHARMAIEVFCRLRGIDSKSFPGVGAVRDSPDWDEAWGLAEAALVGADADSASKMRLAEDPKKYRTVESTVSPTVGAVFTAVAVVTLPVWWFPVKWYVDSQQKQRQAEYDEYKSEFPEG